MSNMIAAIQIHISRRRNLRVSVLAVLLEVLAHVDGLLDEVVQVLGDLRGNT